MSELYAEGLVTIKQGNKIIVDNAHNKFTNIGLLGILSPICSAGQSADISWRNNHLPSWNWSMYVGSNTANPTTTTMTALVNPIGAAPGTVPNTKTLAVKNGTADGIWAVTWTCTWTAGTISGIIGEVGLYLAWWNNATFRWYGQNIQPSPTMGNRLSVADGEFEQFTIDTTKPLAVDWKIQFSFN